MKRLDELTTPPQPGRFYWVPVVRATFSGCTGLWPVIGPKHDDAEDFNVSYDHFHVDLRFLNARQRRAIMREYEYWSQFRGPTPPYHLMPGRDDAATIISTITGKDLIRAWPERTLQWRPRKCWTSATPYAHGGNGLIQKLRHKYHAAELRRVNGRRICPHRGADLTTIQPDATGRIVCPLHGLTFQCVKKETA